MPLMRTSKWQWVPVDRPVLLLAVPGSGKTTTLVSRAAYLTEVCGIPPERILTLTYTVAASRDMHRRFSQLFGEEKAEKVKFQTINALCQWIIYFYNRRNGSQGFRLLEEQLEGADPEQAEIIRLAAQLSARLLDGKEVALP